jgi:hypothetical protein
VNSGASYLQLDEIWTYIGKKRGSVRSGDSHEPLTNGFTLLSMKRPNGDR